MQLFSGAAVKMSSVRDCDGATCFEGAKAVDGIYQPLNKLLESVAYTNEEENPWIQIDLGDATCIAAVRIWNRHESGKPGMLIITLFDTIIRLICSINHKVVK